MRLLKNIYKYIDFINKEKINIMIETKIPLI
jgi:hypothetical protein